MLNSGGRPSRLSDQHENICSKDDVDDMCLRRKLFIAVCFLFPTTGALMSSDANEFQNAAEPGRWIPGSVNRPEYATVLEVDDHNGFEAVSVRQDSSSFRQNLSTIDADIAKLGAIFPHGSIDGRHCRYISDDEKDPDGRDGGLHTSMDDGTGHQPAITTQDESVTTTEVVDFNGDLEDCSARHTPHTPKSTKTKSSLTARHNRNLRSTPKEYTADETAALMKKAKANWSVGKRSPSMNFEQTPKKHYPVEARKALASSPSKTSPTKLIEARHVDMITPEHAATILRERDSHTGPLGCRFLKNKSQHGSGYCAWNGRNTYSQNPDFFGQKINYKVLMHQMALIAAGRGEQLRMCLRNSNLQVSHLCHNGRCVNSDHLIPESPKDNLIRSHCKHLHVIKVGKKTIDPCRHSASNGMMRNCVLPIRYYTEDGRYINTTERE